MTVLAEQARAMLESLSVAGERPRRVGKLTAYDGQMFEATGFIRPIGSGARIRATDGRAVRAEVIGFRGGRTLLTALEGTAPFANGARVEPDLRGSVAAVGSGLLGRVIDGLGVALDGLGPIAAIEQWPLAGRPGNPLDSSPVTEPFDVGVRAVNALLTAGVGQRLAIIAGSGVGKSVLLGQMLAGSDAEINVIGLVGERSREISDFLSTGLAPRVRAKSVVVAVPADHAPLLRLRAAMRATAIAEYFRSRGKKVLLLVDSLTRVAHAQRELGLSLGEPPTVKGYPPSALGIIPQLVERAGNDRRTGGSITALYTVLADGDDTDDPIVDSARAIADGHILLSRPLSEQGVFPAIDIGRSLSRIMADLASPAHLAAAASYRRLWSAYEENKDLILMGAYASGGDAIIDEALERRGEMLDLLRQGPGERHAFAASVDGLVERFGR